MAFNGDRYRLAFDGSFNGNENLQQIPPGNFTVGSKNLNTHNGGAEKRGGTAHVGGQISATLKSLGGGMLVKKGGGSRHRYWCGDDGHIYRDGLSVKSGRSTTAYNVLVAADDKMFIANGVDVVQVDTGSAIADIATPAADWTGAAQPKGITLHSKEASRRLFAWGVSGKEDTLYYSDQGAFETFSGAASGTIVVDTGHGDGITNCISKDGTLWIFTKKDVFILDDSSLTIANWGVYKAPIAGSGGCHSPRHAVIVKNSIFSMTTDGDIYEVITATQLREFKRASIIEPFFLHNYFDKEWDLSKIDQFHLNYDPEVRAFCIFGVKSGESKVSECLKFYINQSKWAPPHDASDNTDDSGYQASASYLGETSAGLPKLYTQDYEGYTWELETTAKTDNGNAYTGTAFMSWLDFDLVGINKLYKFAQLNHQSQGDYDLKVRWYVDGVQQAQASLTLESDGAALDSFVLDTDTLAVIGIDRREFKLGATGEKIRVEMYNDGAGEDFFLVHLLFMFKQRGVRRL